MTISDHVLVIVAIGCFVLAAFPPSRLAIGWQWLGFACLAATLL